MQLHNLLTNDAVLAELGRRFERYRLQRNRTQAEMAEEAGIGEATLQRFECGQSVQATTLIKLLRAMELLPALDAALPEALELPIAELEREQRKARRRVRPRSSSAHDTTEPAEQAWRWGDEPEASA